MLYLVLYEYTALLTTREARTGNKMSSCRRVTIRNTFNFKSIPVKQEHVKMEKNSTSTTCRTNSQARCFCMLHCTSCTWYILRRLRSKDHGGVQSLLVRVSGGNVLRMIQVYLDGRTRGCN